MSRELFNQAGKRLYLTVEERRKFLAAAAHEDRTTRTFCAVLAHTGCRISEALALTPEAIDSGAGTIVFESLKKRTRGVYRAVPVPPALLEMLELAHGLKDRKKKSTKKDTVPPLLWDFGRTTAWKKVIALMKEAGIKGPHATPKGLRHGFGVNAVQSGVPLNLLQRWLGHAQLTTTAIYANAMGPEERNIAAKMWAA
jgi:integrase/recombinase XerD